MSDRWVSESESKGRAWKNTKTGTVIHLLDTENPDEREKIESECRWVLTGFNSVVMEFNGSEQEAKEKAREWMRDNPNPSSMI